MKKIELFIVLLIIFFSGLLVIDPLLHQGIFKAHDIETNIIYFGSFFSSLSEGNIIPRWAGNIANLYGSPTIMFFYPFSYYLTSPLRFIGLSLIDTMKFFIFLSFIASGLFMYIWLRRHFNKISSLVGAFLYIYAPYRINDIYARGSVAENTAFMTTPLAFLSLYLLCQKQDFKRVLFLTFVISTFLLSHPFLFLVFSPFFLTYVIYLRLDRNKIRLLCLSGLLTLGLISFYVLPLLMENKYTHYDMSPFNGQFYFEQFVTLEQLIQPQWTFIDRVGKLEYQTYQIGLLQIGLFIISIVIFLYKKFSRASFQSLQFLFLASVVNFLFSIFLMLGISNPLYKLVTPLQRIEFPWRFLALNLFSVSLMTTIVVQIIKHTYTKIIFVVTILLTGIILYLPHAKGHDYRMISDDYYLYEITENTDAFATLPKWAAQPDKYPRQTNRSKVIEGEASLTPLLLTSTKHIYSSTSPIKSRLMDATFYFPGWTVLLDGKPIQIEFQDPDYRGIITFEVPEGKHLIEVVFQQTKLRLLADMISIMTLILIIIMYKYKNITLKK